VKANHVEKTAHPCQFPVALVERLILALTNPGDLVVDPYIGVGTTAVAGIRHGRRVAGADTEARYIDIARERIAEAAAGTLKVRPRDKPVYEPSSDLTLARIPVEWAAPSARLLERGPDYEVTEAGPKGQIRPGSGAA
jgi:hypothetical protein